MTQSSLPIVTKDDIRRIKSYIATAKKLPPTIEDVVQQLKTPSTGIIGLEPLDIVTLNHTIINNANAWKDIEYSMKRVGGSLSAFSEDLESFGQDIISAIENMPGYLNYLGTIETLSDEEINSLPPLEIDKAERIRFGSIQESLVFIARSIDEKKLNNQDVLERLKYFKTELNDKVYPGIGSKLKLLSSNELNRQITKLNADIDEAQKRIDEKTREIEPNFFEHIFGFISPISSFAQSKLLEIKRRAYLDPLIKQRDLLTEQVKQKDSLTGTLLELHTNLESLSIYVEGAISSTSQLETLWISISEYINSSGTKVAGMHDLLTLRSFVSSLKIVLKNWSTIRDNANALITAFD
jgi:hypothetical protein